MIVLPARWVSIVDVADFKGHGHAQSGHSMLVRAASLNGSDQVETRREVMTLVANNFAQRPTKFYEVLSEQPLK